MADLSAEDTGIDFRETTELIFVCLSQLLHAALFILK